MLFFVFKSFIPLHAGYRHHHWHGCMTRIWSSAVGYYIKSSDKGECGEQNRKQQQYFFHFRSSLTNDQLLDAETLAPEFAAITASMVSTTANSIISSLVSEISSS